MTSFLSLINLLLGGLIEPFLRSMISSLKWNHYNLQHISLGISTHSKVNPRMMVGLQKPYCAWGFFNYYHWYVLSTPGRWWSHSWSKVGHIRHWRAKKSFQKRCCQSTQKKEATKSCYSLIYLFIFYPLTLCCLHQSSFTVTINLFSFPQKP